MTLYSTFILNFKFLLSNSNFHASNFQASVFRQSIVRFRLCNFQLRLQFSDFRFSCDYQTLFSDWIPLRNFGNSRITSWHYSGFGTKLSPFFGFAKSSQIQNKLPIKPIAKIRCSSCYVMLFFIFSNL
jgi:hypothetical protein